MVTAILKQHYGLSPPGEITVSPGVSLGRKSGLKFAVKLKEHKKFSV